MELRNKGLLLAMLVLLGSVALAEPECCCQQQTPGFAKDVKPENAELDPGGGGGGSGGGGGGGGGSVNPGSPGSGGEGPDCTTVCTLVCVPVVTEACHQICTPPHPGAAAVCRIVCTAVMSYICYDSCRRTCNP
jgi:hypothetical protein